VAITLKHQTAMLQLMQQFDRQRERIASGGL
jgi:ATP-binding cassette subfamily B protein